MSEIIFGPLLGLENDQLYSFCVLTRSGSPLQLKIADKLYPAKCLAQTPSGFFWRAEADLPVKQACRQLSYSWHRQGETQALATQDNVSGWRFTVPGKQAPLNIAYASCNGFHHPRDKDKEKQDYALWHKMHLEQEHQPYHLLIMGGDQIYADELPMSPSAPHLNLWFKSSERQKLQAADSPEIHRELDQLFERQYFNTWGQADIAAMLASVPSIMMWDDHDIIDGWGSYPKKKQRCPVFQAIFHWANIYFRLFQLRGMQAPLLDGKDHASYCVLFRRQLIVAMDNRSERRIKRIMSKQHWQLIHEKVDQLGPDADNILLLSAVPVVYPDFERVEKFIGFIPYIRQWQDDIRDHWRANGHIRERAQMIRWLLSEPMQDFRQRFILSGDVHVGGFGQLCHNKKNQKLPGKTPLTWYQLISSGIVNYPPKRWAWPVLRLFMDSGREHKKGEKGWFCHLFRLGNKEKLLRKRNYLHIRIQENHSQLSWKTEALDIKHKVEAD
ncbi:alkaline phosphatase family protein [Thalassomonas viridans]|uniref:Alkaline phosphatase family protein n=1 Tax=Thalassomonas viridans TaxID=137584 RepID=A0AAE9Z672_9GAMM|nr:alkaline phosphatase D family protein [Thalassomonas viridans]WDE06784.1 alkaline phosphatase family protein [Thalassomonas viridans]